MRSENSLSRLVLASFQAFLLVGGAVAEGLAATIQEGALAPVYDIQLMSGQRFSPAEGSGKVVVINFWASWCEPCRGEMPALDRYYRKHHEEGLELIAVSMDDPEDVPKAREIMKQYSFSWALIRESRVKGYGRIWRIPLTFVIDRQGILRRDGWFGETGLDEAVLEKTITPLLAAPRAGNADPGPR